LETRFTSIEQSVETLSGGNQQKVAVAKWLLRDAEVFLFDEPTRGIDVAARRRIYRLFESLAANGKGLVIVSSDLEELLETCDRIAVMSAGHLVETFDRGNWSEDKIMQAAFSGYMERQSNNA
jgi:ribose transport system ATP-binding protein